MGWGGAESRTELCGRLKKEEGSRGVVSTLLFVERGAFTCSPTRVQLSTSSTQPSDRRFASTHKSEDVGGAPKLQQPRAGSTRLLREGHGAAVYTCGSVMRWKGRQLPTVRTNLSWAKGSKWFLRSGFSARFMARREVFKQARKCFSSSAHLETKSGRKLAWCNLGWNEGATSWQRRERRGWRRERIC